MNGKSPVHGSCYHTQVHQVAVPSFVRLHHAIEVHVSLSEHDFFPAHMGAARYAQMTETGPPGAGWRPACMNTAQPYSIREGRYA